jgi:hypothetical protein
MAALKTVALTVALAAAGCVKGTHVLTINADGSGSLEIKDAVAVQSIHRLKVILKLTEAVTAAKGGDPKAVARKNEKALFFWDPTERRIRDVVAGYKAHGITLQKVSVKTRGAWRHVHVQIRFESLERLARTDFFPACRCSLTRNPAGDYVIYRPPLGKDFDAVLNLSNPKTARLVSPLLKGLFVVFRITVPGNILETNSHKNTTRTAAWGFDLDSDRHALRSLRNQSIKVVFEDDGLSLPEVRPTQPKRKPQPSPAAK